MDFELLLVVLTAVAAVFWIGDRLVWRRRRGSDSARPAWLEYTAGFFPVLVLVLVVRSFLFEPFNIPSGSMIPTLRIGDLVLVQKFSYDVRLPVVRTTLIETGRPERGDVAVFRFPKDPSIDYIKRIVALPGDTVEIKGRQLSLNGQPVAREFLGERIAENGQIARVTQETLGSRSYRVQESSFNFYSGQLESFPFRENCQPLPDGVRCRVPEGHYFAMGDNRDNSADSRFWGFVPHRHLVGKAFLVWFNAGEVFSGDFSRLGFID